MFGVLWLCWYCGRCLECYGYVGSVVDVWSVAYGDGSDPLLQFTSEFVKLVESTLEKTSSSILCFVQESTQLQQ